MHPTIGIPITDAYAAPLQEAFAVASTLVPPGLRSNFMLAGRGAMLYHGSSRVPGDLDVVGTPADHWAFLEGACKDARFSVLMDDCSLSMFLHYECISVFANPRTILVSIQYTACVSEGAGINISIELLELGGEACPAPKHPPVATGNAFVASMPDLCQMKSRAFVITRPGENENDLNDFIWLTNQMAVTGVKYDPVELLEMILDEAR